MMCTINFLDHFSYIEDPRIPGLTLYPLDELLLTTLCAVISGCEDWVDIALYGHEKLDFLRNFLPYKAGIPSYDVFNDVFDSKSLQNG